ncbi:hypothetical protein ACOME3_000107 [Neoechinorhynchus agilis]
MSDNEPTADERAHRKMLKSVQGRLKSRKHFKTETGALTQPMGVNRKIFATQVARSALIDSSDRLARKMMRKMRLKRELHSEIAKSERAGAYSKAKENLSFWDPFVKSLKSAPSLTFPLMEKEEKFITHEASSLLSIPDPLAQKSAAISKLIETAAKSLVLKKSDSKTEADDFPEPKIDDLMVTASEYKKLRQRAEVMKKQNRRVRKIKSRNFHRLHRKLEAKKAAKAGRLTSKGVTKNDRIEERMTLKHNRVSRKLRKLARHAKYDPNARQLLHEHRQLGLEKRATVQTLWLWFLTQSPKFLKFLKVVFYLFGGTAIADINEENEEEVEQVESVPEPTLEKVESDSEMSEQVEAEEVHSDVEMDPVLVTQMLNYWNVRPDELSVEDVLANQQKPTVEAENVLELKTGREGRSKIQIRLEEEKKLISESPENALIIDSNTCPFDKNETVMTGLTVAKRVETRIEGMDAKVQKNEDKKSIKKEKTANEQEALSSESNEGEKVEGTITIEEISSIPFTGESGDLKIKNQDTKSKNKGKNAKEAESSSVGSMKKLVKAANDEVTDMTKSDVIKPLTDNEIAMSNKEIVIVKNADTSTITPRGGIGVKKTAKKKSSKSKREEKVAKAEIHLSVETKKKVLQESKEDSIMDAMKPLMDKEIVLSNKEIVTVKNADTSTIVPRGGIGVKKTAKKKSSKSKREGKVAKAEIHLSVETKKKVLQESKEDSITGGFAHFKKDETVMSDKEVTVKIKTAPIIVSGGKIKDKKIEKNERKQSKEKGKTSKPLSGVEKSVDNEYFMDEEARKGRLDKKQLTDKPLDLQSMHSESGCKLIDETLTNSSAADELFKLQNKRKAGNEYYCSFKEF